MLKHEEVLTNDAFQSAVYLSTVPDEQKISLYALINELKKIYDEVGNGPVTIIASNPANPGDSTYRQMVLSISTADKKIHSFYIHP